MDDDTEVWCTHILVVGYIFHARVCLMGLLVFAVRLLEPVSTPCGAWQT